MTKIKGKITLLICLVLSLVMMLIVSSCDSTEESESNADSGTETETDSPHVHTEEIIPAIKATCQETGLTEGKKCSECGEVLVEQEIT
ncbi:MAG: hypothetical protein IJ400_07405, partial [Clostridia bacterium]|nr:hypothetical protein [Clostridia bacterium]